MTTIQRLAVFCGSRMGVDERHAALAAEFGATLAARGIGLVYGGGSIGLMGVIADAVLGRGGEVVGVITEALAELEVGHAGLSDLITVATMHERKARMADLADGFVMLPGGYGTLDEFFEVVTWSQLGIHAKPCGILDPWGYYGNLLRFIDDCVSADFVTVANRDLVLASGDATDLLENMQRRLSSIQEAQASQMDAMDR